MVCAGGTYFSELGMSLIPQQCPQQQTTHYHSSAEGEVEMGGMISFCGKDLMHGGDPVTDGVRYIMAGFCYVEDEKEDDEHEKDNNDGYIFNFSAKGGNKNDGDENSSKIRQDCSMKDHLRYHNLIGSDGMSNDDPFEIDSESSGTKKEKARTSNIPESSPSKPFSFGFTF
uniref:Uncharacterized protein n=2 Tax=Proboscia inermis TaxID=420281 RepID=A0A7S0GAH3_9STRA|mmetsp:Transcript_12242/g.12306  ORF Transcript_12242/g.12306 Transcript_12242/m.12306 type:complete len:171 (+) Transcript_12242:3-515(+)